MDRIEKIREGIQSPDYKESRFDIKRIVGDDQGGGKSEFVIEGEYARIHSNDSEDHIASIYDVKMENNTIVEFMVRQ